MVSGEVVDEKLRSRKKELFFVKLVTTSLFMAIGLSFYFYQMLNLPSLLLIFCGAMWNFFVDINTLCAFILSVVVGFIYSSFAMAEGLYVNSYLYLFFYVPLQFVVWVRYMNNKDITFKRNKKLSPTQSYYIVILFMLLMVSTFALGLLEQNEILPAFDAITACLLGLSACLQSFGYREYFMVRPISILFVLELWFYTILNNGIDYMSLGCIILYLMYFVIDAFTMYLWYFSLEEKKQRKTYENDASLKQRLDEYNEKVNKRSLEENDNDDLIA